MSKSGCIWLFALGPFLLSNACGQYESGGIAERGWKLRRQRKGKELMEIDQDSDSELEDMAEKLLFEGDFDESTDEKGERGRRATVRLRNLGLDDSMSREECSEDEDEVDQLFEQLEEANLVPGLYSVCVALLHLHIGTRNVQFSADICSF